MSGAVKGDKLSNSCEFLALGLIVCVAGASVWFLHLCAVVFFVAVLVSLLFGTCRPSRFAGTAICRALQLVPFIFDASGVTGCKHDRTQNNAHLSQTRSW